MNPDALPKIPKALASGALRDYLSQMDVARQTALGPLSQVQGIAKQLQGMNSAFSGASAALQLIKKDRERYEKIRRVLDPLKHLQEQVRASSWIEKLTTQTSAYQPMIDRIAQFGSVTSAVEEIRSQISSYYTDVCIKAVDALPNILTLDALSRASAMTQEWQGAPAIFSALSSIDSITSSFEKLSQLSPAWAQAAELASLLDDAAVDALGTSASSDDTQAKVIPDVPGLQSAAFDRPPPDLIALAGLILNFLMLLFTIQQAISEGRWQTAQAEISRQQLMSLQSISVLLEKSVQEQERRQHQVFVVKERPALVRSSPYSRSAVLSTLEPAQSVKPIGEHGKWIEVEYFDRLTENYEVGWVLKKYLRRVHQTSNPVDETGDRAQGARPVI